MAILWDVVEPTDDGVLEDLSKKVVRDGEKRLMLAMLENVVEDFQKYVLATDKKGKDLFNAAEEWIMETDSPSFFSFECICAHLELDPDYMRKGLMRWKEAALNQAKECAKKTKSKAA
ncbi:MAG TPA: hypothetical protein VMT22_21555 [Terriglobales bacterium]|jgi:hypothetical protein|nr:hypothetical protein [Terriglobales bacterium]